MLSRLLVPDTYDYMVAGYIVLTVVLTIYITSIALRWKKTVSDLSSFLEEK